jgi:LPXTG-motif cell wall-anchored protein
MLPATGSKAFIIAFWAAVVLGVGVILRRSARRPQLT